MKTTLCVCMHMLVSWLNSLCKIKNKSSRLKILFCSEPAAQCSLAAGKGSCPLCMSYTSLSILFSSLWKEKYSGMSIFSSSLFRAGTTCLQSPGEPSMCSCPGTPHGNVDPVPGLFANRLGRRGESTWGRGSAEASQSLQPLSPVY